MICWQWDRQIKKAVTQWELTWMKEAIFLPVNDDKDNKEGVITWHKMGEGFVRELGYVYVDTLCTHKEAERGWCGNRNHMCCRRSRKRRGFTLNKTPRPSLPSIHLESSWCLLLHWMHIDSAVTGEKTYMAMELQWIWTTALRQQNISTLPLWSSLWAGTGAFLKRFVASFLKEISTLDIPNLRGKEYL